MTFKQKIREFNPRFTGRPVVHLTRRDDDDGYPEVNTPQPVNEKPVALTRDQALRQHSAKIGKLEADLSKLKSALSLSIAKVELLAELQVARANFWDTEKCRRIEAAVKELDSRLKAVNANI